MFDTNWNPDNARPVMTTVLQRTAPSPQEVNRAVSLYYMMIGSLASITQTAVKDLLDALIERKDFFRHSLKYHIKEAYARSEQLIKVFRDRTSDTSRYQMWLDITDGIEEDLRPDVTRLFYTTDNILLKHNVPEHRLQSMAVVAYNLTIMLHDMSVRYDDVVGKLGFSVHGLKPDKNFRTPMYGMFASMRAVADILVKDKEATYYKEGGMIYKALEVLALKVTNMDRIEHITADVLNLSGVDIYGDDVQNNAYEEWNETQEAILKTYYREQSDEDLAKMLGRSVGSIKARMRKLGIKRSLIKAD